MRWVEREEAVHSFDIGEEVRKEIIEEGIEKNRVEIDVNHVCGGNKEVCDSTVERSVDFHMNKTVIPHRPSGQHLLIDLLYVNAFFLNSESRLANAMVKLITSSGLTLLSYHCHTLRPMGVSCVGVLLESHVSFHTWPTEGVITLDLFTCGSASLLPSVSLIQDLFGIANENNDQIVTKWSHELRGFRKQQERLNHVLDNTNDLANDLLSSLDTEKVWIVSEKTMYNQVDVWDVKDVDDFPTWEDARRLGLKEGDGRYVESDSARLMRGLYINGKAQSSEEEHHEFYESFIHPALTIHTPTNILLINPLKGSSLYEVLKWDTVENVIVLDPDEHLLSIVKEHLPFLTNCSDIKDSTNDCYDDERVWLYHEDPKRWLELYSQDRSRVPRANNSDPDESDNLPDHLDVIYMDPLDHFYARDIESQYFQDSTFLTTVYKSLNDNGILVIQIGLVPSIHDPQNGTNYARDNILTLIENHSQTEAILIYEEPHVGFEEPTAFLIACKSRNCRDGWYRNSHQVDYLLKYNLRESTRGNLLVHYDGSTHVDYQYPSRGWEVVYCKREPMPVECGFIGLDKGKLVFTMDIEDKEESSFEVRKQNGKYSIISKVFIPRGSYIMPDSVSSNYWIHQQSKENLQQVASISNTGKVSVVNDFLMYVEKHGKKTSLPGLQKHHVEVSWSGLIRKSQEKEKVNVGWWICEDYRKNVPVYSPVWERHWESYDVFLVSQRDIGVGEELVREKE